MKLTNSRTLSTVSAIVSGQEMLAASVNCFSSSLTLCLSLVRLYITNAINNRDLFLMVLETEKSESKVPAEPVSGNNLQNKKCQVHPKSLYSCWVCN